MSQHWSSGEGAELSTEFGVQIVPEEKLAARFLLHIQLDYMSTSTEHGRWENDEAKKTAVSQG